MGIDLIGGFKILFESFKENPKEFCVDMIEMLLAPLICLFKGHKWRNACCCSLKGETHICKRCCKWRPLTKKEKEFYTAERL